MGKDAEVRAILADGEDRGRLQAESLKLVFRGARAGAGDLVLARGARFALGDKADIAEPRRVQAPSRI